LYFIFSDGAKKTNEDLTLAYCKYELSITIKIGYSTVFLAFIDTIAPERKTSFNMH